MREGVGSVALTPGGACLQASALACTSARLLESGSVSMCKVLGTHQHRQMFVKQIYWSGEAPAPCLSQQRVFLKVGMGQAPIFTDPSIIGSAVTNIKTYNYQFSN